MTFILTKEYYFVTKILCAKFWRDHCFCTFSLKSDHCVGGPSKWRGGLSGGTTNSTEKFRGIYTVGWNYHRKRPNTIGKRLTVGIIFCPSPEFFHNFVSFHPILMFLTILESRDKNKNIEDDFKTI